MRYNYSIMQKQSKSPLARAGSAGRIASGLVLPILAGFFLGDYLDNKIGWSGPWMTLTLLMLGVIAGFGWLYRISIRDEDDE
jgi:F0F1-type ATP synthase assembly protein I